MNTISTKPWHHNSRARAQLAKLAPAMFRLRWSLNIGAADGWSIESDANVTAIRAWEKLEAIRSGYIARRVGLTEDQAVSAGEPGLRVWCAEAAVTPTVEDVIFDHFGPPMIGRVDNLTATVCWRAQAEHSRKVRAAA